MDGATWKSYFNGIDGFGDIRKATGKEFPDYKGGTFTGGSSSSNSGDNNDGKSKLADVGSKLTTIFTNYVSAIMGGKTYTGTDFSKKDGSTNGGNNSSTLTSANIKKLQDIANRASKISGLPAD